jgi:hypothetical protein
MPIPNAGIFKGLLCSLLSESNFFSVNNDANNEYIQIVSHGGVSNNMIMLGNDFQETRRIDENDYMYLTEPNFIYKSRYTKMETTPIYTAEQITDAIENINKVLIDTLESFFYNYDALYDKQSNYDEFRKPTDEMLYFLLWSAPFNRDVFNTIYPNMKVVYKYETGLILRPGIKLLETDLFFCSEKPIIQIMGHEPHGLATSFKSFNNNASMKTFLINLDYSNSFLNDKINASPTSQSYLLRYVDAGKQIKYKIKTDITLSPIVIRVAFENFQKTFELCSSDSMKNYLFTNSGVGLGVIGQGTKILFNYDMTSTNLEYFCNLDNKMLFFHGIILDNEEPYYVITLELPNITPFYKTFLILTKAELQQFVLDLQQKDTRKKYLKYKKKYQRLKNKYNI